MEKGSNQRSEGNDLPQAFLDADALLTPDSTTDARLRALLVQAATQVASDPRALPGTPAGERAVELLLGSAGALDAGHFLPGDSDAWVAGTADMAAGGLAQLARRQSWAESAHGATLRDIVRDLLTHRSDVVRMRAAWGIRSVYRDLTSEERVQAIANHLRNEPHPEVRGVLLSELAYEAGPAPAAVDEALRHLADHAAGAALSSSGVVGLPEPLQPLVADLAVRLPAGFVAEVVTAWFADPLAHVENVTALLHWLRLSFLNPSDGVGQQEAFALLGVAASVAARTWKERSSDETSKARAALEAAVRIAECISQQILLCERCLPSAADRRGG